MQRSALLLCTLSRKDFLLRCSCWIHSSKPHRNFSTFLSEMKHFQESRENALEKVASSFKEWFLNHRSFQGSFLASRIEDVSSILSQETWNPDTEAKLQKLNLTLDDKLVSRVLKTGINVRMAIKFFDWAAQQRGYRHTLRAYYSFFIMLSRRNMTGYLEEWLRNFRLRNPKHDSEFYSVLCLGYCLAGKPDVALQLFGQLWLRIPSTDEANFADLVNILAKGRCFLLSRVVKEKFRFQDWAEIEDLVNKSKMDEARILLGEVISKNVFVDVNCAWRILLGFCRNWGIDEAGHLIHSLSAKWPIQMSKVYGNWIEYLVAEDRALEALYFLQHKVSQEFLPHPRCYSFLIRGLLKKKKLSMVSAVLEKMKSDNVFPDQRTMNAAVQIFSRSRVLDIAMSIYNERTGIGFVPNNFTYSILVFMLRSLRRLDEAYRVFSDGISCGHFPRQSTMFRLARDLSRAGKYDLSCNVLTAAIENGYAPDYSIAKRIIAILCEAGRVDYAEEFLHKLKQTNLVVSKESYSFLIEGFCHLRRVDMAYSLLLEMRQEGHVPSQYTLLTVFRVLCEAGNMDLALNLIDFHCFGCPMDTKLYNRFTKVVCSLGRPEIAITIIEKTFEKNQTPDIMSYINLLYGYLKCESVVNAMNLFKELQAETSFLNRLYNVMVSGLCSIGKRDLALMYFEEMINKGLVPSHGCFAKLIHVLCHQDKINLALRFFKEMKMKGYQPRTFTYNVLLGRSFKMGEVNRALYLLNEMRNQRCPPNVATFGIVISGLSKFKRLEPFIGVLEEMMEECPTADILLHNMLIRGLCQEGKMELACDLFNRISEKGCMPNRDTYNTLIKGFCRSGRFVDAQNTMSEMLNKGFHPHKYAFAWLKTVSDEKPLVMNT